MDSTVRACLVPQDVFGLDWMRWESDVRGERGFSEIFMC